jgi:hypothetical protein
VIEDQEIAAAIVALSRATVKIADLLEVIVSASVQEDQPNYTCPDYADTMGDD